ncbi:hypothetical protein AK812_SmicGene47194 [Symbiodinium microadriaticum]|uniref:Uncharacterized protein n=1 Tax=Symbiodinium microadriaticum TaxID=2951 RepID=A0A1Q9BS66_SYMMI|nr:hypothetical protein AK812_SmicGene47194 [Symbiodinium microadriaticum]
MLQPSTVHTWRGRRGLTERVLDMATIDSTKKKYICGFTVHDAKELSQDGTAVDPLVVARCLTSFPGIPVVRCLGKDR